MAKKKQIDKQFKIDAVNYRKHHPELTMAEVANNLGISLSSIHRWIKEYSSNSDDESKVFRGSGNYSSDDAKELARFERGHLCLAILLANIIPTTFPSITATLEKV